MQYTNLTRSVPSLSARGHAHTQSNNTQQKEKYKHTCMYKIFHRLPCSVRLAQAQPNTNVYAPSLSARGHAHAQCTHVYSIFHRLHIVLGSLRLNVIIMSLQKTIYIQNVCVSYHSN